MIPLPTLSYASVGGGLVGLAVLVMLIDFAMSWVRRAARMA